MRYYGRLEQKLKFLIFQLHTENLFQKKQNDGHASGILLRKMVICSTFLFKKSALLFLNVMTACIASEYVYKEINSHSVSLHRSLL